MTSAVLHIRFPGCPPERYPALLRLLHGITPVVQALPPDAALADVRGARRYFDLDAVQLARLVRVRALALHGADCAVGVAGNPLLARLALDRLGRAPGVFAVPDTASGVAGFLADQPVATLPGVGPATARALAGYGLETAGETAAAPPATLQRILGAATARRVLAAARGVDQSQVVPSGPARVLTAEHRFAEDELDAERRRRALLTLADELGFRLRDTGQTTGSLTLTVRYADLATTTRGRALPEPTAHTPALAGVAYALHDALGLQRARVRAVALRADALADAAHATRQLSLDPRDERRRLAEAAADRARRRFGPRAAGPAGILDVA
ncbi:DNA polymerase Y family protein [Streptomyces mayteni]